MITMSLGMPLEVSTDLHTPSGTVISMRCRFIAVVMLVEGSYSQLCRWLHGSCIIQDEVLCRSSCEECRCKIVPAIQEYTRTLLTA